MIRSNKEFKMAIWMDNGHVHIGAERFAFKNGSDLVQFMGGAGGIFLFDTEDEKEVLIVRSHIAYMRFVGA